ncbi:hypothetical protein SKAU_G00057190 [Synaphobranchus kaupii]|uniref:Uncharacterized protein n=1 Tax=Synaphobranchus kaupii TaxID=118154 RepID=A0A9Q1G451_SYNKA|nr:hypothetical protein SKAU_G00057190 [Synaphobranchus kaupii]
MEYQCPRKKCYNPKNRVNGLRWKVMARRLVALRTARNNTKQKKGHGDVFCGGPRDFLTSDGAAGENAKVPEPLSAKRDGKPLRRFAALKRVAATGTSSRGASCFHMIPLHVEVFSEARSQLAGSVMPEAAKRARQGSGERDANAASAGGGRASSHTLTQRSLSEPGPSCPDKTVPVELRE